MQKCSQGRTGTFSFLLFIGRRVKKGILILIPEFDSTFLLEIFSKATSSRLVKLAVSVLPRQLAALLEIQR